MAQHDYSVTEVFEAHLRLIVNTSTDVWHARVTGRHWDA